MNRGPAGELVSATRDALLEICEIEQLSVAELCRRAKVSRQAFYDAFRLDGSKTPTLLTLHRYANALGCDVQISFVPRTVEAEEESIGGFVPGYLEMVD